MLNKRRTRTCSWMWVAVIGAGLLSAEAAWAYCLKPDPEGDAARWKPGAGKPVVFRITNNPPASTNSLENAENAIGQGIHSWGSVDCTTLWFEGGPRLGPGDSWPGPDNSINIYWFDKQQNYPGSAQQHIVTDIKYGANGSIVRASIAINGFSSLPWSDNGESGGLDLRNEITYFAGQLLGLAESETTDPETAALARRQNPNNYKLGEIDRQDLKEDDELGALWLYFDSQQTGCPQRVKPGKCDHAGQVDDGGLIFPDAGAVVDSGGGNNPQDGGGGNNRDGSGSTAGNDAGVSGKSDTGTGTDQGNNTQPKDDGGCSMLSLSATTTSLLLAALLAMLVARRRRRERSRI